MQTTSLIHRIEPLLEEHLLCSLKIKQLIAAKGYRVEDQLEMLQRIREQDEKRLIEDLRNAGDEQEVSLKATM